MAILYPTTLDPASRGLHRTLTMPLDIVLDAWLTRHGDAPVAISRILYEDGSADSLTNNMACIVYRMCHMNSRNGYFEQRWPRHMVRVYHAADTDAVLVRVFPIGD